jgi:hypothetical protein
VSQPEQTDIRQCMPHQGMNTKLAVGLSFTGIYDAASKWTSSNIG